MNIIYLSAPYTHPSVMVRKQRFLAVTKIAGDYLKEGQHIISPITHSHPIVCELDIPHTWEFWKEFDYMLIRMCSKMVVLMIDGWNESVGVQAEIEYARKLGLPIGYKKYKE